MKLCFVIRPVQRRIVSVQFSPLFAFIFIINSFYFYGGYTPTYMLDKLARSRDIRILDYSVDRLANKSVVCVYVESSKNYNQSNLRLLRILWHGIAILYVCGSNILFGCTLVGL